MSGVYTPSVPHPPAPARQVFVGVFVSISTFWTVNLGTLGVYTFSNTLALLPGKITLENNTSRTILSNNPYVLFLEYSSLRVIPIVL